MKKTVKMAITTMFFRQCLQARESLTTTHSEPLFLNFDKNTLQLIVLSYLEMQHQ